MVRVTRSLAWEILARSRTTLACICVALAVACVIATWRTPPVPGAVDGIADLFVFVMVASMMFVFGAFNHTHFDRRTGQTGFPNRSFTYPVRTRVLVGVPMGLGVAFTVVLYLAWTTLVLHPLGRNLPLAWPATVLAAAMAWYQATLWSLAAFRVLRMIALCVLGTTLITVALIPTDELGAAAVVSNRSLLWSVDTFAAAAYVFALLSVKRQRHGGGHGAGLRALAERLLDLIPSPSRPFRSPAHAQFWLEAHRGSLLLPAGTLLVMFVVMLTAAVMRDIPADAMVFTLTIVLLTPLVLAVLAGSVAGMPLIASADGSLAPFLSTRPISSGDMVLAKLAASALACTLAWLVVLVLAPVWLISWCDATLLVRAWEHFSVMFPGRQRWLMLVLCAVTVWLLTWRMSMVNLHVALAGRAVFLTLWVIASIGVTVAAVVLVSMELDTAVRFGVSGTIFSGVTILAWVLNLALVAKVALTAASASKAASRGWMSGHSIGACGGVWLVANGIVALTLYLLASHEPTLARAVPSLGPLAALWGLLLVPLARVALATQTLASTRHR